MGLGSTLALLGLIAAGLPILVHLMRQRDLPRRTLPTIMLLQKAAAESRRRFRVRDRLLLALRVAALAALAFAAVRPFLLVHRAFDDNRLASLVVVLDDSMSMTRIEGGDTLLDEARGRAIGSIEGMVDGSEVAVVLAGHPSRLLVPRTSDRESAIRAIRTIPDASARGTDLATAVDLARRALSGARHARRLWVLSDFASHAGIGDARLPEDGVALALERLGAEAPANHAILEATGAPDPTRPGEASVQVTLRGSAGERLTLVAEHEGTTLTETEVVLDDAGAGTTTFHVPLGEDPAIHLRLAEEDALPADDRRGVLLRPGAALRVLLVDGDPHPARTRDEVGFLSHALDVLPRERGPVRYRTVDADAFDLRALENADVVVLANVAAPSSPMARALASHVAEGGGLWVSGGSAVAPRAHRAVLGELLPADLGAAVEIDAALSPAPLGLESAQVRRLHPLEPDVGAEVIASADGYPIDVRGSVGDGRVALWASTFDDDWTDIAYHPGFIALVDGVLRDLGAAVSPPPERVEAGATLTLGARVLLPSGEVVESDGTFDDTTEAGVYRVLDDDDDVRFAFSVAAPADESELRPAALPDVNDDGLGSAGGVVSRRPIDPWWFLLGGLLLLAESVIRKRGARPVRATGTG